MRKRICGSCGKIINEGMCACRKAAKQEYNREHRRDEILDSYRWKKKRKQIVQRDGGLCQRCFYKYKMIITEDLQVHHIKNRVDFPELAFDDDNLICVCQVCNRQLDQKNKLDFEWNNRNIDFNL